MNVLGTYSFIIIGRHFEEDDKELRKAVKNVWFAGEATEPTWYGTVNGAYDSGKVAAKEMSEDL